MYVGANCVRPWLNEFHDREKHKRSIRSAGFVAPLQKTYRFHVVMGAGRRKI